MKNKFVKIASLVLATAAIGLVIAKIQLIGTPLLPNQVSSVWTVEARVTFDAMGRSARVNFDVPDKLGEYLKLDEFYISRNYGLNVSSKEQDRRAEWSTRSAKGQQRLYYRIEVVPDSTFQPKKPVNPAKTAVPDKPDYPEPLGSAIADLLDKVRNESADIFTFTSQVMIRLNRKNPGQNTLLIMEDLTPGSDEWAQRIMYVLQGARITARLVRGISLEEKTDVKLVPWLEVYNGESWEGFDPQSGNRGYPPAFLRWSTGNEPLLDINGGKNERITFTLSQRPYSEQRVSQERARLKDSPLGGWSLYKLPLATQDVYRILIMLPLGALVVVFMRTFMGVPSFGTFMPILISLAFRETELLWGILFFCLITGSGLVFRFSLERMNLLLVPRLSAVLVMVIVLMLALSLVSNQLDLERGISIALFPIVILTMVIERMSITWEEAGPFQAAKEGAGSLFIAVIGYYVMTNDQLEHLMFHFPELLLLIMAGLMLAGRYTGYRLSELFRFKDLVAEKERDVKPD